MPITKRGIYHNLKESKYTISNNEIVFFFSSRVYLNKFMDEYKENRLFFLSKMAKIAVENPLNMGILADISLYKRLETRGCRIWLKGVEIGWNELHRYALRKMIDKNMQDWREVQKPKLQERVRSME